MRQKTAQGTRSVHPDDSCMNPEAPPSHTRRSTQYLAGGLATLAALSSGTLLSWSSPGLALLQHPSSTPHISSEEGSWVGSLLNIGALLGALPAGLLADRVGRRLTLLLLAPVLVTSWLLVALCSSAWDLYAARLLGGAAVGAVSVVAPVYCTEVAERSIRGTLGSFFQLQLSAGILLGYVAGLIGDTTILALVLCALPLLFLVVFPWAPESPAFLASRGRENDAAKALRWLRGPNCDVDAVAKHLAAVNVGDGTPWWRLILRPSTRRALIVALGLMTFQQFSGVNAVIFYAEQIFSIANGQMSANTACIVVGAVQVAANYASVLLVDCAGRKVLLLFSAIVMALSLGVLGTFFHLDTLGVHLGTVSWTIPPLCLASYVISFSLGFGPIAWILLGELFPPEAKGAAAAAGAATSWLTAFIVTRTFTDVQLAVGPGPTFWMFSAVCVLAVPFVIVLVPETKGRDLEDIQDELAGEGKASGHDDDSSDTGGV